MKFHSSSLSKVFNVIQNVVYKKSTIVFFSKYAQKYSGNIREKPEVYFVWSILMKYIYQCEVNQLEVNQLHDKIAPKLANNGAHIWNKSLNFSL